MAAPPTPTCLITADPDIAGIGVRVAFYLQALLPLVSIVFIRPSAITLADAALVEKHHKPSNASLVAFSATTSSLLIVAFIKRGTRTLSPYHAIVVLNLTWIVLISSCCRAAIMYCMQVRGILWSSPHQLDEDHRCRRPRRGAGVQGLRTLLLTSKRGEAFITSNHIPMLCLQLSAVGILGWLLFSDISRFSGGKECPDDTILWMGGFFIHITTPELRRFWKAIYIMAILSPLTVPITVYLSGLLCYPVSSLLLGLHRAIVKQAYTVYQRVCPTRLILRQRSDIGGVGRHPLPSSDVALMTFELLSGALLVLLIVSTEKTIMGNPVGANDEGEWGFGQILALVLSTAPLYEAAGNLWMCRKLHTKSRTDVSHLSQRFPTRRLTFGDRLLVVSSSGLLVCTVPVPESKAYIIDLAEAVPQGGEHLEHVGGFDIQVFAIGHVKPVVDEIRNQRAGVQVGVQLGQLLQNPADNPHHRSGSPSRTRSEPRVLLLQPMTPHHEPSGGDRSLDQREGSGTNEPNSSHRGSYPESFQVVKSAYLSAVQLCVDMNFDFIELHTIDGCLPEVYRFRHSLIRAGTPEREVTDRMQKMTQDILVAVRAMWSNRMLAICICCERKDWDIEATNTLHKLLSVASVDLVTASSEGCTPLTCPVLHIREALARMTGEHGFPLSGMVGTEGGSSVRETEP